MDGLQRLTVEVQGVVGLIMHNGQLANPFNEFAQALKEMNEKYKGSKNKTEDVYREMARVEFKGGLYMMEAGSGKAAKLVPCVPANVIMGALRTSAKRSRLQPKVRVGVLVPDVAYPLKYDGPTDPDAMLAHGNGKTFVDQRMMKVGTARVLRTRPIFRQWGLAFTLDFDPKTLSRAQVEEIVHQAGRIAGFGDSWPEYGRFNVVSIKAN